MAWVLVIHCNAKWPTLLTDPKSKLITACLRVIVKKNRM
jgi:hypothetical protein